MRLERVLQFLEEKSNLFLNSGVSIFVKNFISGLVELPGYSGAMMAMNLCGRKNPFGISMILTGFFLIIINSMSTAFDMSSCRSSSHLLGVPPKPWLITTLAFIGKALITAAFGTVYVVSGELFPTIMRTTGVGIACCVARVGGILAPWIALLGERVTHALLTRSISDFIHHCPRCLSQVSTRHGLWLSGLRQRMSGLDPARDQGSKDARLDPRERRAVGQDV